VARGELVSVLEKFCEPFPGYYLYYPHRRHAAPALRALIDHLRRGRRPYPAAKSRAGRRASSADRASPRRSGSTKSG